MKRKNAAAAALGRKGGKASAAAKTPEERSAKARHAVAARKRHGPARRPLPCRRCRTATTERDSSRRPWCGCAQKP